MAFESGQRAPLRKWQLLPGVAMIQTIDTAASLRTFPRPASFRAYCKGAPRSTLSRQRLQTGAPPETLARAQRMRDSLGSLGPVARVRRFLPSKARKPLALTLFSPVPSFGRRA